MSYDIEYHTNVCPHCKRGVEAAARNVTYNLARLFAWAFDQESARFSPAGIRWLDGKTGSETVDTIRAALARLHCASDEAIAPMLPANGWGTRDSAAADLRWMAHCIEDNPDGAWSVR